MLPLVNMGVTSALIPRLEVPRFITGELTKNPAGQWVLPAVAALGLLVFFGLIFVLPAMVLGHQRFGPAVKKSLSTIAAYKGKILGVFLIYIAAWLVLFLLPRQVFNFFYGATSVTLSEAVLTYGLSLKTPVLLLVWAAASLMQTSLMPLLLALLTACYLAVNPAAAPDEARLAAIGARLDKLTGWLQRVLVAAGRFIRSIWRWVLARPFVQKHRRLLAVVAALLLLSSIVNAFFTTTGIHDPIVVGHRGSAYGVENTLEAIDATIDAGADYTEVDILLSADGVPMVIHDANLKRLSGQNVNVYDLTAAELGAIPLAQNGYTGRISTLEEVVAHCEGRILLAVEYKLHGHEKADVVDKVMQVMQQSAYQKDSLYLSLDYDLVAKMRAGYPSYRTGYCVYGNVGQFSTSSLLQMDIDFLLVEEWMASRDLVTACRKAWLPVYVWTVNDTAKMDDYLRMGIAGLVTDYPDDAMALLGTMYDLSSRTPVPEPEVY